MRRRFVPDQLTYDYAIIRVVPKVEREEFVNVGASISCGTKRFLEVGKDAGAIGEMPQRDRFHWLVAPRRTIIAG
ncbi:MAG: DUF3037 domain-containing protein [Coleofasciculaceae cyanobacterium]